jgi:hypothetical protein
LVFVRVSRSLLDYAPTSAPLLDRNHLWSLCGAGFESLGRDGQPVEAPMLTCGPDELLVCHDAVGLCLSNIKPSAPTAV